MRAGFLHRLRLTLEMVRFSHSVFALPFALLALVLASGGVPRLDVLAWTLLAMVAARSAAMGFNRIADRRLDALNPRTAGRHLVTGAVSVGFAWAFTIGCAGAFVLSAAMLNETALLLSPAVLAVLLGYSLLKRFTAAAHFGVGLALGLSPLGAWVAGAGGLHGDLRVPLLLGLAVVLWVGGFDVIYACQDAESDRREGLRSIPARLGVPAALRVAALCHVLCIAAFVGFAPLAGLSWPYLAAVGVAAALLLYEHRIVSPTDLTRVNVAFFNVNGVVALLLGAAGIADALTPARGAPPPAPAAAVARVAPPAPSAPDDPEFALRLLSAGFEDYARKVYERVLADPNRSPREKDKCRYGLALLSEDDAYLAGGDPDTPYAEARDAFLASAAALQDFAEQYPANAHADEARLEAGKVLFDFTTWARDLADDAEACRKRRTDAVTVLADAQKVSARSIDIFDRLRKSEATEGSKPPR